MLEPLETRRREVVRDGRYDEDRGALALASAPVQAELPVVP